MPFLPHLPHLSLVTGDVRSESPHLCLPPHPKQANPQLCEVPFFGAPFFSTVFAAFEFALPPLSFLGTTSSSSLSSSSLVRSCPFALPYGSIWCPCTLKPLLRSSAIFLPHQTTALPFLLLSGSE